METISRCQVTHHDPFLPLDSFKLTEGHKVQDCRSLVEMTQIPAHHIMEEHCGHTESRTAPLSRCKIQKPTLLPLLYCQETSEERPSSSWKDRLVQLSNLASIICAIDCTVLPVMTILLSFLGLAEQPHSWEWLHVAGHGVAIYFVLPGMCLL
jgi:MerC mercury resistance protein